MAEFWPSLSLRRCVETVTAFVLTMANRTKRSPEKGERLLQMLAMGKSVTTACVAEGIGRTLYYDWRKDDPAFAKAADEAIEKGIDRLEDEAMRRAGSKHGSDTMLIFMLKTRRRDVYGDKWQGELSGKDGAPFTIIIGQREDGPQ